MDHYRGARGADYLAQRAGAASEHVQRLRASLFADLGAPDITLLDFGCGTGGVLSRLAAKRRIGIEIGEEAASLAREHGIETHPALSALPDACVDVAISFHALEHVESPASIIRELRRVVKPSGHIRLVVPGELADHPSQRAWQPNADMHLFTWTPLTFGNLAAHCGLAVIGARLEPMPTASRLVRHSGPFKRQVHWWLHKRRNVLNVIVDARPA